MVTSSESLVNVLSVDISECEPLLGFWIGILRFGTTISPAFPDFFNESRDRIMLSKTLHPLLFVFVLAANFAWFDWGMIATVNSASPLQGLGHDHAVVEALLRLPKDALSNHPTQKATVERYLERVAGTSQFLKVIEKLNIRDKAPELAKILRKVPFTTDASQAARLLLQFGEKDLIRTAIDDPDDEISGIAITALGYANSEAAIDLLTPIAISSDRSLRVRTAAATALGRSPKGQRVLLNLVKESKVNNDLQFAVADALLGSANEEIRKEAAAFVKPASAATSEPIPPTRELDKMRGDAAQGKIVFNTLGTCIKCHKVQGEGKEVGPDLSEIGSKLTREDMYVAILNPSSEPLCYLWMQPTWGFKDLFHPTTTAWFLGGVGLVGGGGGWWRRCGSGLGHR